jgi:hypothetical protein
MYGHLDQMNEYTQKICLPFTKCLLPLYISNSMHFHNVN